MRTRLGAIASLLLMLASGCNTVSSDDCWPNTSGGFGGEGPIPIGVGVGATTGGDYPAAPGSSPLGTTDKPNPCIFTCVDDCEWEKKECDKQCRKIPENKKKEREACWSKCENEYANSSCGPPESGPRQLPQEV